MAVRSITFASVSWPLSRWSRKAGSAIAARMPMIRMHDEQLDEREAAGVGDAA